MYRPCTSKLLALVSSLAFACAPLARPQETRPRRAQPQQYPATGTNDEPTPDATPTTRLNSEPLVRIGLATGARSVTISTSGATLLASADAGATQFLTADAAAPRLAQGGAPGGSQPVPLGVARVRVEPRVLAPLAPPTESELFRVEIASVADEAEARRIAREAEELTGEAPEVARDDQARAWRVRVGAPSTRAEADDLRARLEEAGIAAFSVVNAPTPAQTAAQNAASPPRTSPTGANPQRASGAPQTPDSRQTLGGRAAGAPSQSNVRLTSRASPPTRGLVVYSGGASRLMDARAPVTFSSADERAAPVRFNEKPYRGRIEVFSNLTGSLTVVNVLPLEDYVRGVVPNELSPAGYGGVPALESLKAQAVAARTYAVSNRGQFAAAGFDLLPSTRSQVYGGLSTEHPLSSRAVEETRGLVATYHGQPINALYTSTCGGHTEDAENIFGGATVPYLRGRACSVESAAANAHAVAAGALTSIETAREPPSLREAEHAASPREVALLAVNGFNAPAKLTDEWLDAPATVEDVRALLATVSRLARRPLPSAEINADAARPGGFATALALAVDFESRGTILLDEATINYLLAFRDAADVPARNRADVAYLLREGHLQLYPDATLRPRQPITRARAVHAAAHLLEARELLGLQRATARQPSSANAVVLRGGKSPERAYELSPQAFIFRAFGDTLFQTRAVPLAGGEPVAFHTDARGAVDYIEVRPAASGASAERYSPFTNWTQTLNVGEVAQRLASHAGRVGAITDLRVVARGTSHRALDLEVVGTAATAHVRGGRIRTALGLREQLFVVDRRTDEAGRVVAFTFTGRGWGHGVGMCQYGAYGMARAGLRYDQILKHYYTGIDLTKMY
ncbi:MAG: SpoIID/LytB domain-containing protein [Acidobacteria bacterium]|nr:SpoIID/LytB domain-containing protein [Acidobacteriota bacterium]